MNAMCEAGAWVVAVYKVISQYAVDDPALDPLEAIITAGRAADLFSATRSLGEIDADRYERYRMLARLKPASATAAIQIAERAGFVAIQRRDSEVQTFQFTRDAKEAVLEATAKVFSESQPTGCALAILTLLQMTVALPTKKEDLQNRLAGQGVRDRDVTCAIKLAEGLGLISVTQETEAGQNIILNPYLFQNAPAGTEKLLLKLNEKDQITAQSILEHVRKRPGVPLPENLRSEKVLSVLIKVGLVDYSKITTSANNAGRFFATAPAAWGIFTAGSTSLSSDLTDDAKLFLNSLRYGQFYSSPGRGQIRNPSWIVNRLLSEGAVGTQTPATAIGEDYPLALSRGIVNIVESRVYANRYSMELLKRDVAEAVSEVLEQQAFLPSGSVPSEEDLERAGSFTSPGAVRVEKKLPPNLQNVHDELVFGLRTMRKGR